MANYNHLDVLKRRKLNYLPPHFAFSKISLNEFFMEDDKMLNWIKGKLKGKFSLGKVPMISNDEKLKTEFVVGFEDHQELTYFLLACPYIRRNK